jgi:hypothetical protein
MSQTTVDAWTAVETTDPAILDQVYRLRVVAWQARNPDFPQMDAWTDAFDATGRHWVILDGDAPVAAARLTVHDVLAEAPSAEIYRDLLPADLPGPIGVLTRLVVAPRHAGLGLSQVLDVARIEAARQADCRHLIGATLAGLPRIRQMLDLGFEICGEAKPYGAGPLHQLPDPRITSSSRGGGTQQA